MTNQFLKEHMLIINDRISKIVLKEGTGETFNNCLEDLRVIYNYKTFYEDSETPFDYKKSVVIDIKNDVEPLPGYTQALATMKLYEKAKFWISHDLLGFPLNKNVYMIAEIFYAEFSQQNAMKNESFNSKFKIILDFRNHALSFYQQENYKEATESYKIGLKILNDSKTSNEAQELKKKVALEEFYQNIALCCIKKNSPRLALTYVHLLEKLTSIEYNLEALYIKGKAFLMIKNFTESLKHLKATQFLLPSDPVVEQTLNEWAVEFKKETSEKIEYLMKLPPKKLQDGQEIAMEFERMTTMFGTLLTTKDSDDKMLKNSKQKDAVSTLYEFSQKNHLEKPIFEQNFMYANKKYPKFTMTCKFLGHEVVGEGKLKKDAKQAAAKRILMLLDGNTDVYVY
ncbi:CLUMA_CG007762, isoform A [Clunio marinus]|uniref:CLUMA_CG007762, isoform A n=1 Tax=Clunio marinus TaxID=568069 RepID=A0A1J1I1N1_9DIPT|nr:CLUMA_CG007762, isoform A [Clunio marinus]